MQDGTQARWLRETPGTRWTDQTDLDVRSRSPDRSQCLEVRGKRSSEVSVLKTSGYKRAQGTSEYVHTIAGVHGKAKQARARNK